MERKISQTNFSWKVNYLQTFQKSSFDFERETSSGSIRKVFLNLKQWNILRAHITAHIFNYELKHIKFTEIEKLVFFPVPLDAFWVIGKYEIFSFSLFSSKVVFDRSQRKSFSFLCFFGISKWKYKNYLSLNIYNI